jgi:hypothetical protein
VKTFITGTIPKKIAYVHTNKVRFYINYDMYHNKHCYCKTNSKYIITKIANPVAVGKNEQFINDKYYKQYLVNISKENLARLSYKDDVVCEIELSNNSVIKNVRLIAKSPYNSNSFWHALINNKYVVTLSSDTLNDVVLNCGIGPNGQLNGEFIWVNTGNKIELFRVGSENYNKVLEYIVRSKTKSIEYKDLEVGGVYSTLL